MFGKQKVTLTTLRKIKGFATIFKKTTQRPDLKQVKHLQYYTVTNNMI